MTYFLSCSHFLIAYYLIQVKNILIICPSWNSDKTCKLDSNYILYTLIFLLLDILMCKSGHFIKFGPDLRTSRNDNLGGDKVHFFLFIIKLANKQCQGHTHDQGYMEVCGNSGPQGIFVPCGCGPEVNGHCSHRKERITRSKNYV